MSVQVTINGQVISLPSSSQSPNWSPGIIEAFQAIESALNSISAPFDISPQVYTMASNANTNVNIPNLNFPTSDVRAGFIRYSVFRETTGGGATIVYEAGHLDVVFDGSDWEIVRDYEGDAKVTFGITSGGQLYFSSDAISGSSHTGFISFAANVTLQQD